jgi:predicted nucleotidyltransferase component of viral defense system
MIERNEIEAVSSQLGIHTSHVQRDYVYGWLLSLLYSSSPLGKQLVLKGGNCLRKAYFEGGRYSRDLDFSTATGINDVDLARELNAICHALEDHANIVFDTERTRVEEKHGADEGKKISEARLYFRDFYGQESEIIIGIRLDISQFNKLYLPVQERILIHPYSDTSACATVIRCVKLEELLATKMRCLLQRRHIADLFDLIYATIISQELEVNRLELMSVFFRITIFGNSPGVAKGLFIDLPIEALGRLWTDFISCPKKSWFSFEIAKDHFLSLVDNLIPDQAIHERSSILFPSSLRNPIMEAGQNQTLLKLGYDGMARLVEPYSLIFKTRKDGVSREYFYGYDTTGGRSGPGIKAFLPGRVEFIECTDQTFEPRFEVELRKAGAAEIADRFKSQPRLFKRTKLWSMDFEIQCPYCLRKFKRTSSDYELRPHKDRFGNTCPGRHGYRV